MFVTADAPAPEEASLEALEHELCELSAAISAAQGRFLRLLGEFVARGGTDRSEVTPARWVSWRLGHGTAEARRTVALAERLRVLPHLAAACEEGRVTASLAATVARTARETTDEELVALCETAAPGKVERVCRTKARIEAEGRSVDPAAPEEQPPRADDPRYASWGACDDGRGWELHAWLPSVEGARVDLALEAARRWLRGAGDAPDPEVVDALRAAGRAPDGADALVLLAETLLAHGPRERGAADRHQVVVHVDVDRFAGATRGASDPDAAAAYTASGGTVDAATVAALACDSRLVGLVERAGRPVRIGDPTAAVPAHIRRAVLARDGHTCAHPACGSARGLEVHHVVHRAAGGDHDPVLLVTLCWADHAAHHRGRFDIVPSDRPGRFRFVRPGGEEITGRPPPGPEPPRSLADLDLPPPDPRLTHDRPYGDRLTAYALDVILCHLFRLEGVT